MTSVLNDATAEAVKSLHAAIASLPPSDHRDALATGLDAVLACVEDHIVSFYGHMRREYGHDDNQMAFLPTILRQPTHTAIKQPLHRHKSFSMNGTGAGSFQGVRRGKEVAQTSLAASMYLMIEAIVVKTTSKKGAIYLQSEDAPDLLRCVAMVGDGLPYDVSLATGSSIGTVFTTGVAYNLSRATKGKTTSNAALRAKNVMCFPIPVPVARGDGQEENPARSLGCVVVADCAEASGYPRMDEQRMWGLCQVLAGLVPRYPLSAFQPSGKFDAGSLKSIALLPPATESQKQPLSQEWNIVADDAAIGQIVYRTQGKDAFGVKDVPLAKNAVETDEESMQDCASYVRSLEAMWRNTLDTNAGLQQEISRWHSRVDTKEAELISKEVSMKTLVKQFRTMKTDVSRIKAHLREKTVQRVEGKEPHPPPTARGGSVVVGLLGDVQNAPSGGVSTRM